MVTIGITAENNEVIDRLFSTGYFKEASDVACFAFAYTMKNRLDKEFPDYHARNATTKWAYENLDSDRLMYSLITVLYPDIGDVETKVQELVNLGLEKIGERISKNAEIQITDLMD